MSNCSGHNMLFRPHRNMRGKWLVAWGLGLVAGAAGFAGCGPLEPIVEQEVSDLQLTVDTLKTSLRDSQRTIAELRSELESRRQELADSQIARAQMDGRIREAERRLTEARHVIDLQREELAASRTERQRVSQAGAALHNQLKQLQKQLAKMGKQFERGGESGAAPANLSSRNPRPSAVRPVNLGSADRTTDPLQEMVPPTAQMRPEEVMVGDISPGEQTDYPASLSVKPGDTLWGIAKRFHVTVQDLMAANELPDTRIFIGQAIRLPSRVASGAAALDKSE